MSVQSLIDSILAKLVESKEHAYDVCRGICETCDEDRNNPNVRTTIEIEEPGELIKLTIFQVMSTRRSGYVCYVFDVPHKCHQIY